MSILKNLCKVALVLALFKGQSLTAQTKVSQPGGKLPKDVKVSLVEVASGFIDPINVGVPKDGSNRIFVVERHGVVRIIENGKVQKRPFLDISDIVVSSFVEQGLYDIEFHPNYKENGLFYVHYNDMWFNGDSMVVEYKVSSKNKNKADRKSARVIMRIGQPYANHNGGEIAFGPDGYLYIGSGDGGWEGDVLSVGQDLSSLLGKILRIDVNGQDSDKAYRIPKDNPFITPEQQMVLFGVSEEAFARIHPKARPEIWAYGLRNPLKFQFDAKTKDLYIADVGQNHWEELNFQAGSSKGGENYGWKMMCGSHNFPISRKGAPVGVMPIAEYSHVDQGICTVGLGIYRGAVYPSMDGVYFLSDWGSGKVWGVARDKSNIWQVEELLDTQLQITGSGEGEDGTIYVTNAFANYGGPVKPADNPRGSVWMLVPADKVPAGAKTAKVEKK
ncbi:MAG: PQQ-dependent sugar dehydrogenase [Lentisphaeraceae bacterium]|nr:PQQ-dependent sugar dehydrogenase [Lentisphaeraceae bacterium]